MKRINIHCPYCGTRAALRPATVVYGSKALNPNQQVYVCGRWPVCNAYVSADSKTKRPMGTLANSELRNRRILAHHAMANAQNRLGISKDQLYALLSAELHLPEDLMHIALCGEYRCDQIIAACERLAAGAEGRAGREADTCTAKAG